MCLLDVEFGENPSMKALRQGAGQALQGRGRAEQVLVSRNPNLRWQWFLGSL